MSLTGVYDNDAMLGQIAESVRINRVAKGSLINTKKELLPTSQPSQHYRAMRKYCAGGINLE